MLSRITGCLLSAVLCTLVLFIVVLTPVIAVEKGPVGIDALDRVDLMPYLWPGREARHVSSHDPTGANADRGHYLSTSTLLFDAKGPGCIYRIWTTNQLSSSNYTPTAHGNIRILIDDSTTPALDIPMATFFSGNYSIFQTPLAGNAGVSSGGFYSYVPIPYRKSCKIIWVVDPTSVPGLYFNIDYMAYDSPDGITSFTGQEENASAYMTKLNRVKSKWLNFGTDPKQAVVSRTITGSTTVPAGGSVVLGDITGPGSISAIKIRKNSTANLTDDEWKKLYIRINFDDQSTLDVQAPFSRFFGGDIHRPYPTDYKDGYETIDGSIKGLMFGSNGSTGWNYNFFPMPFASRAVVELCSPSSSFSCSYEISVSDMPDAPRLLSSGQIGYFNSTKNLNPVSSTLGQDYNVMNVRGRGVVVGLVYTPYSNGSGNSYLEGDERIHIDDSLTPAIYGTGTEDIFNGGWYFKQGRFSLPTHGYTASASSPGGRSMYRLFIGDSIPYSSSLKLGIECGATNDISGAKMYSTVYYYSSPATAIVTDTLDIADTASETAHEYTRSAKSMTGPYLQSTFYEGDNDKAAVSDYGRHFMQGYSQFKLNICPDNYGVKLRRMSYYTRDQTADVYVDDRLVGTWYDAGWNSTMMWRDSEFIVPVSYTQGKQSIVVKISSFSGQWTEYKYQALTFVSPQTPPPSPVVTCGPITGTPASLSFSWTKPYEPVWGIASYAYAVGTTPGGNDIRDWTAATEDLSMSIQDLQLNQGKTCFVSVRAKNGAGVWSVPGVSEGVAVPHTNADNVKSLPDGEDISLAGMVVTAAFNGVFYAGDTGRNQGIRVKWDGQVSEGDVVYIEGTITTVSGERQINATQVNK